MQQKNELKVYREGQKILKELMSKPTKNIDEFIIRQAKESIAGLSVTSADLSGLSNKEDKKER